MKRSTFLRLSAFGAAGLSIPFIQGCTSKPVNKALAQPLLLSHIFDAKTMKEIGQAYIQQAPGEGDAAKLTGLLTADSPITKTTEADAIHTFYDGKTKEDFKVGKTLVVNGWILSQTEARQCALFSLI
jgi:hypothetical protein